MDELHSVEVVGTLSEVRFPNLCARCGATPPAGALPLTRLFVRAHRHSNHRNQYLLGTVRVPFCRDCLAEHQREVRPPDEAVMRRLRRQRWIRTLPFVVPLVVIVWLLGKFVPVALASVPDVLRAPTRWGPWLGIGAVTFLALCLLAFVYTAWSAGREVISGDRSGPDGTDVVIVPGALGGRYVVGVEPTSTLASVTFADEQYMFLEANKRTFTFTNPLVASQFAAVNADRVWTPDSPRAQRGMHRRYAATVGIIVVGGAYIAWELLFGFRG